MRSVAKPTGLLHTTGGAEVGVTTKSTTALTFDEVMDLFYALRAPYRKNAVFITNDATVKALRKLKNGNGDYIWQPSVKAGTPDTILNRPVYTSTFMPTLATGNKTILFGDLNDPDSDVRRALDESFAVRRRTSLGTGPSVYYMIKGGEAHA